MLVCCGLAICNQNTRIERNVVSGKENDRVCQSSCDANAIEQNPGSQSKLNTGLKIEDCELMQQQPGTEYRKLLLSLTGLPNCIFETQDRESNRRNIHQMQDQPHAWTCNEPTGLPIRIVETQDCESRVANSSSSLQVLNVWHRKLLLSLTGLPNCIFKTQDCEEYSPDAGSTTCMDSQ